MGQLVTEAIVLHAFDYLETSRIVRLMTRDAGIQSVIARGARNSRKRFGGALDLFAQGTAEIHMKPQRDLHALVSIDIASGRSSLGADVGRFTAASMIAELALRCSSDEPAPGLFDAVELALDRIANSAPEHALAAALAGAWYIVGTLGFTPELDACANCHLPLDRATPTAFSHVAGGALCERCAAMTRGTRVLPASARDAIREWVSGREVLVSAAAEARAHQRLLREFVHEHLDVDREMKAYKVWESGGWSAA